MPTNSHVLNKSKFHFIYSFNPKLERQRMGFQESGEKEDDILLVWNSVYICCPSTFVYESTPVAGIRHSLSLESISQNVFIQRYNCERIRVA